MTNNDVEDDGGGGGADASSATIGEHDGGGVVEKEVTSAGSPIDPSSDFESLDPQISVYSSTLSSSKVPDLVGLLTRTDIFARSWAEPERDRSSLSYHSKSDLDVARGDSSIGHSANYLSDMPLTSRTRLESNNDSQRRRQHPSPVYVEYDALLARTNHLLGSIESIEDSSLNLQLMDFDDVMVRWSRLHAQFGEGDGIHDMGSMKRKAFNQCSRLLHALERNHDCILDRFTLSSEEDVLSSAHARLIPNATLYNLALHALANSDGGPDAAHETSSIVLRMLDRCRRYVDMFVMEDKYEDRVKSAVAKGLLPPPPCEPTVITMNSALHAVARSGAPDAGHWAEEVYLTMERWREECEGRRTSDDKVHSTIPDRMPSRLYRGVTPNARTLACVIDAWANARSSSVTSFAPERADAILHLAIARRRAYVDHVTGKTCLQGVIEKIDPLAEWGGDIEEEIVEEEVQAMEVATSSSSLPIGDTSGLTEMGNSPLRPNVVAFNTCIHAWASCCRGREGALRAEELLFQLQALSDTDELNLPGEVLADDDDAQDAGLKPNVRTYSMVMNAWANVATMERGSGEDAASRCEDILIKMEERGAVDSSVRPNLVSYVTSISAWARTRNAEHAASRAENILNRMVDLYYMEETSELPTLDGDVENVCHDAPFNSVITCYARSTDPYATERAHAVLERLIASPIHPTVTTFNAVLDACGKHGHPDRALEVLSKMKEMSIRPDSTSYDTVLNAFARCDKPGSAEQAYDFLRNLEESPEEYDFTPSTLSYSTVINAFSRASGKDSGGLTAVKRAKEIYERLIDRMKNGVIHGAADPFANSCLLNCCANVYGSSTARKEALVTAIDAFEEMKKRPDLHGEANHYTFGTMLKVCNKLSSDDAEKHRLMENLFVQACKRGTCSAVVLGQFLRNTPPHVHMNVILSRGGSKREIPHSWYRNVARHKRPTPM